MRACQVIDAAEQSVGGQFRFVFAHMTRIRLAAEIRRHIIRIKRQFDNVFAEFDRRPDIAQGRIIFARPIAHTRLAVAGYILAKPEISQTLRKISRQTEINRGFRAAEVIVKGVIHF